MIAFAVGALAALGAASAVTAAPKPTPSPTPPPVVKPPPPVVPSGPTPVADGASGADLVEATGEQVTPPAPPPTTTSVTQTPPTVTVPTVTPPPAVTTPVAVAVPVATRGAQPVLPRDGAIVLAGVLLIGLAVALRAIRARERRIGFALLAFCLAYLVVLAGLVSGVAGA